MSSPSPYHLITVPPGIVTRYTSSYFYGTSRTPSPTVGSIHIFEIYGTPGDSLLYREMSRSDRGYGQLSAAAFPTILTSGF